MKEYAVFIRPGEPDEKGMRKCFLYVGAKSLDDLVTLGNSYPEYHFRVTVREKQENASAQ